MKKIENCKKSKIKLLIYSFLLMAGLLFTSTETVEAKTKVSGAPAFSVSGHQSMVGDIGPELNWIGSENEYWLEGITLSMNAYKSDFTYKVKLAGDETFSSPYENGEFAGTTGQNRALTGFLLETTGKLAKNYTVYYRCWLNYLGATKWEKCGSTPIGSSIDDFYIRKIEFAIVPKGGKAPASDSKFPGYVVVSPYEVATWSAQEGSVLRLSQLAGGLVSHANLNAIDSTWMKTFHSPFTALIEQSTYSYGRITFRNANGPTHTPSGLKEHITISTLHSSNFNEFKKGDIVARNQKLLDVAGTGANGNTEVYDYHTEIRCSDTYVAESDFSKRESYQTYAFDIFFVDPIVTNVIEEGIAKSGTAEGYLSSYRGRWSYRDHRLPWGAESFYTTAEVINKCPLRVGPAQCYETTRTVYSGNVNIIGKVKNGYGNIFYVLDTGEWAYEGNVKLKEESNLVQLSNITLPTGNLAKGNIFYLKGSIHPNNVPVSITVRCRNSAGQVYFTHTEVVSNRVDLQYSAFDKAMAFNHLPIDNGYKIEVIANDTVVASTTFNVI